MKPWKLLLLAVAGKAISWWRDRREGAVVGAKGDEWLTALRERARRTWRRWVRWLRR